MPVTFQRKGRIEGVETIFFPLDTPPAPAIVASPIDWDRFPPGFTKHPVHLHHSHRTGLTIGAVHALCNAYLWQYHGE